MLAMRIDGEITLSLDIRSILCELLRGPQRRFGRVGGSQCIQELLESHRERYRVLLDDANDHISDDHADQSQKWGLSGT